MNSQVPLKVHHPEQLSARERSVLRRAGNDEAYTLHGHDMMAARRLVSYGLARALTQKMDAIDLTTSGYDVLEKLLRSERSAK